MPRSGSSLSARAARALVVAVSLAACPLGGCGVPAERIALYTRVLENAERALALVQEDGMLPIDRQAAFVERMQEQDRLVDALLAAYRGTRIAEDDTALAEFVNRVTRGLDAALPHRNGGEPVDAANGRDALAKAISEGRELLK